MAEVQEVTFEPTIEQLSGCIHSIETGELFFSPFDEEQNEVLIRTASGATSIFTGIEYPVELFEIEESDEAEDDEYLLELVPAGLLTLEVE